MRKTGLLLISLLFCVSCTDKHDHKGQTPLVEVDGNFLYKEDLQAVFPAGLSKDDSLLFAEHYIRSWVEDVLLFNQAQSNIPDNGEIDKLVANYRKALIMHTYQQELISQKLSGEIPEQEIADYYEKNKELFKLDRPLMKGLFIKVPLTAPQLGNVRKWYKTETQDAVEHLEKYSLQNAVKYEYFYDKWVRVADVLDMIVVVQLHSAPRRVVSPDALLINRSQQPILMLGESHVLFLLILVVVWPHDAAHGAVAALATRNDAAVRLRAS